MLLYLSGVIHQLFIKRLMNGKKFLSLCKDTSVQYKKYFYALRPLLACRFIEANHCPPPVGFKDLLESSTPKSLRPQIEALIEKKKFLDEKVQSPQISSIIDFISLELQEQKALVNAMEDDRNEDWKLINDVFLKVLERIISHIILRILGKVLFLF